MEEAARIDSNDHYTRTRQHEKNMVHSPTIVIKSQEIAYTTVDTTVSL